MATQSETGDSLWRAVIADDADALAKLVLADWLEETRGEADAAFGLRWAAGQGKQKDRGKRWRDYFLADWRDLGVKIRAAATLEAKAKAKAG